MRLSQAERHILSAHAQGFLQQVVSPWYCLGTRSSTFLGGCEKSDSCDLPRSREEDRLSARTPCVPFFRDTDFSLSHRTRVDADEHTVWSLLNVSCFPLKIRSVLHISPPCPRRPTPVPYTNGHRGSLICLVLAKGSWISKETWLHHLTKALLPRARECPSLWARIQALGKRK